MPAEVMKAGERHCLGKCSSSAKRLTRGGQCEVSRCQRPRSSRRRLVDMRPAHAADRGLSGEDIGFRARRVLAERGRTAGDDQVGGLRRPAPGVERTTSGRQPACLGREADHGGDRQRPARREVLPTPRRCRGDAARHVPTEAASAMVDILKDVEGDAELAVSPQLIELRLPNLRLASSLVGGAFPDYRASCLRTSGPPPGSGCPRWPRLSPGWTSCALAT